MNVAVIGSSGGMGGFFVEYFLRQGHEVTGSDTRGAQASDSGFKLVRSNRAAVEGADVVLVATPIDRTVETVREVASKVRRGACVVEISSLKGKILRRLRPILAARGATLLSLHPLFGPSLPSSANMKICVIGTGERSMKLATRLFPDANLIQIREKDHDRAMGVILSLTHLLNIAYAATVADHIKPEDFRKLESPTSAVQLSLAEGVLTQSPTLYSYIQVENEFSMQFASELIEHLTRLKSMIAKKDRKGFERLFSRLSEVYEEDSKTALVGVYEAYEVKRRR
ncbi:MAG: prephenate dehydrogenase/arogenate dehydrogenase family protein [Thaumarchaeota archaeon]|nr:prephenate dehydrogenase/arogenate dehydrogenase family protein [Nitrososphaerota archaeon]